MKPSLIRNKSIKYSKKYFTLEKELKMNVVILEIKNIKTKKKTIYIKN